MSGLGMAAIDISRDVAGISREIVQKTRGLDSEASVRGVRVRPPDFAYQNIDSRCPLSRSKSFLVVAAPPTTNGDLHLGHMSGPYLAADVLRRFLRLGDHDAHFVCGTDDNLSYVPFTARREGGDPEVLVKQWSEMIGKTLTAIGAEPDVFVQPYGSADHIHEVQEYYRQIHANGNLEIRDVETAYCETCEHFLAEVYIAGQCPFCSSQAGGYGCEDCGMPNGFGAEIIDPVCTVCGESAGYRQCRRLFLPLSRYGDFLSDFHAQLGANQHVHTLCDKIMETGLRDIPVSYVADWGVPVDIPGVPDSRFHSIFEMIPIFVWGSRQLAAKRGGDWQEPWRSQGDGLVPFFGYDNAFFYAVLFPVLYNAYDEALTPPTYLKSNEFYLLDSSKFSTSRRHLVWCRDLLQDYSSDVVRFYLAYTRPEHAQTNFTMAEFLSTVEDQLVQGWLEFLNRLGKRVSESFDGRAPAAWNHRTPEQVAFFRRLERLVADLDVAYQPATFSMRAAARALSELVHTADEFARAEVYWQSSAGRRREFGTSVALQLMAAKTLAVTAAPLMPDFATGLWRALGHADEGEGLRWQETLSWVPAGQEIERLDADLLTVERNH